MTETQVYIEMRMLCFTCSACCFWCPNPGLEEISERYVKEKLRVVKGCVKFIENFEEEQEDVR